MAGILLDTHALYWLVSGEQELSDEALIAIGESQDAGTLYVSPITAWELWAPAFYPDAMFLFSYKRIQSLHVLRVVDNIGAKTVGH